MGHSEVARSALPYLAAAAVSWYLYKIFVAPFLSPLRKIPGRPYKPFVGNMLEALGSEAGDNTTNWMTEYKSRIVRFYYFYGECRVLVADPDIVRHVMITNSRNYKRGSSSPIKPLVPGFVLLLDGEEHHAVRKLINPAFNAKHMNDFIPIFEETARKLIKLWQKEIYENGGKSSEVPAQKHMTMLTLEAVCRCVFGYDINSVEEPDHAGVQSFQRILQRLQIKLSSMLPLQRWLPTKENRQMWADLAFYRSTIGNMIKLKRLKMEEGDKSNDMLSRLLRAKDEEGRTLDDKSLFGQIGGFLFAGFETTSMNLTWTLLLLAQHPDVQEKARQEILNVLGDSDQTITAEKLSQLVYLTSVIRESLRLYSPASTVFRRAAKPDTLGGYYIPAGTLVGISIGGLHRLPENYEDPLTFRPERFLEPEDKWKNKFLPFSTGPYMCVGHIFSLTEVKVTLALFLKNFQVALPPGYKFRRVRYLTLQPKPPLSLVVRSIVNE
ncbi:hypothetical protein EGW08_016558 [Elysia chlorotica]|uniref:Cytochrome P450 n=1 Tax=Elysia chlorotica TaxID=188477 RepID=A0A433T2D6_ELYCH|nr:hypothetical protein EGW08_016558 [Elysia chlorotica]